MWLKKAIFYLNLWKKQITINLEILPLDSGNKFNDFWSRVLLAIILVVVIIPKM